MVPAIILIGILSWWGLLQAAGAGNSNTVVITPSMQQVATTTVISNYSIVYDYSSRTTQLSAMVTSSTVVVNAGSVTFTLKSGNLTIGTPVTSNVSAGVANAVYLIPGLTLPGVYQLEAAYNGTAGFAASAGGSAMTITVGDACPLPSITASAPINRIIGSTGVSTIGMVSNPSTPAGQLQVFTTAVPPGIQISNINNNQGSITAQIAIDCSVTPGVRVLELTVINPCGQTSKANLTVNAVDAASQLTLGSYQATTLPAGSSTSVVPAAPPAGGAINILAASNGFTGTFSTDLSTGVVTVRNAAPPGNHTVTVSVSGACGSSISRTFPLTVTSAINFTRTGNPVVSGSVPGVLFSPPTLTAQPGAFALGQQLTWSTNQIKIPSPVWTPYDGSGALQQGPILDLVIFRYWPADRYIATTPYGIFLSTDGGKTYSREVQTAPDCLIRLREKGVLPALTPLSGVRQCDGREFVSLGYGKNWIDRPAAISGLKNISINPANPVNAIGSSSGGVVVTINGGDNWTQTAFTQPTETVLYLAKSQPAYLAAGPGNGLWRSVNNGATWKQVNFLVLPASLINLAVGESAAGDATLPGFIREIVGSPANPDVVYIIAADTANGPGRIYRSQDGGDTWSPLSAGLNNLSVISIAIDLSGQFGIAGTEDGAYVFQESAVTNTPPAIQAASSITRIQGSPGSFATIANISDQQQAANYLSVEVLSAPTGISVTELANSNGIISARVTAGCNASPGSNTVALKVSDGDLSTTANLTITVDPNLKPILGFYLSTTLEIGANATITPAGPPSDEASVAGVTVAAPGFIGALTVNPLTGVVSIGNAGPVGTYTVTVTVADNCGATISRSFFLTVNPLAESCAAPPAGLAAWYRAEFNAADSIGGAAGNGISAGDTLFTSGKTGQSFSFDGDDDFVLLPSRNLGNKFSVEFWLFPKRSILQNQHLISNDWRSKSFGALYQSQDRISYWVDSLKRLESSPIPLAQWTHVALVYDGSVARLYLNGILNKTSVPFEAGFNNPLRIADGVNRDTSQTFLGLIDEVSLYARDLSAQEIQSIVQSDSTGKCSDCAPVPSGLVSWYRAENNASDIAGSAASLCTGKGRAGIQFRWDRRSSETQCFNFVECGKRRRPDR
ncbi:MAG: hypothetical protein IPJ07_24260 [Acidobacteria bacterium]|nr:hypothetical protein [Acidobacteriota bacterium]